VDSVWAGKFQLPVSSQLEVALELLSSQQAGKPVMRDFDNIRWVRV
jgi:hypothetical protein